MTFPFLKRGRVLVAQRLDRSAAQCSIDSEKLRVLILFPMPREKISAIRGIQPGSGAVDLTELATVVSNCHCDLRILASLP